VPSIDKPISVSVIIPVRNEEHYLKDCLLSVLQMDRSFKLFEIFVVDGQSTDRTHEIATQLAEQNDCITILENTSKVVPHAMNIGIRAANGEYIVRVDAHSRYQPDYIEKLIYWMRRLHADNVGGIWNTLAASNKLQARAVAIILSQPFGVGGAQYRVSKDKLPYETDTVPFGCYRREIFERVGLYDEDMIRNQDDELNARLKKHGGKVFLVPEIQIEYIARESLRKMSLMLYQYGYFKPLVVRKVGQLATVRQLAPPLFVISIGILPLLCLLWPGFLVLWLLILSAHCCVNMWASARSARRNEWKLFPYLFFGFMAAHVSYGVGYLRGLVDFCILGKAAARKISDVPMSR